MRETARLAGLVLVALGSLLAREYGPAIGSQMPDFALPDQDGKSHSLKGLLGPKGAVILFFRSADW
jgi:hypothetical protein